MRGWRVWVGVARVPDEMSRHYKMGFTFIFLEEVEMVEQAYSKV